MGEWLKRRRAKQFEQQRDEHFQKFQMPTLLTGYAELCETLYNCELKAHGVQLGLNERLFLHEASGVFHVVRENQCIGELAPSDAGVLTDKLHMGMRSGVMLPAEVREEVGLDGSFSICLLPIPV